MTGLSMKINNVYLAQKLIQVLLPDLKVDYYFVFNPLTYPLSRAQIDSCLLFSSNVKNV